MFPLIPLPVKEAVRIKMEFLPPNIEAFPLIPLPVKEAVRCNDQQSAEQLYEVSINSTSGEGSGSNNLLLPHLSLLVSINSTSGEGSGKSPSY